MVGQRLTPRDSTSALGWSPDLRWAVSTSLTPVLLFDPDGRVAYANAPAHALAKRVAGDAGADALAALVPAHAWSDAAREGRWSGVVDVPGPPAHVLEMSVFLGHDGTTLRRMMMVSDASERAHREREYDELQRTYARLASTQEQLLHSEKMASIGQLAAGVAHEINNPIGYVASNLGTLQEYTASLLALLELYAEAVQSAEPGAQREELAQARERLDFDFIVGDLPNLLRESREGIERVCKIVQDLKDFSRAGRDELMQPADLHRGLDSTLNIVWNDLKYKVRLEKHYGELPEVECLASEINQVFMNLLLNAGQAIEERGTILLASGVDGDEAWVSVTDSGCGIPDEVLPRLFDPFFTTKPIGRGTGLGLAIAYRIVAKHHGRIEVDSRVGHGSTFRVVLPLRQPRTQ